MRHGLTKLVAVSAVLLASAPACATADLSPRLTDTDIMVVSQAISPAPRARHLGLGSLARPAYTDRGWLAIVLGFGLLGALGRRPASPFEEQL